MKTAMFISAISCVTIAIGCETTGGSKVDERAVNTRIIESIRDMGINNAIITQRTLFPYHFMTNSQDLNELGRRDLGVLAKHFRENPGILSIRRGSTAPDLYNLRLDIVQEFLINAKVDASRIAFNDAMPGGKGMSSEQVIQITEGRNSPTSPLYCSGKKSSAGGMGAMSGGGKAR